MRAGVISPERARDEGLFGKHQYETDVSVFSRDVSCCPTVSFCGDLRRFARACPCAIFAREALAFAPQHRRTRVKLNHVANRLNTRHFDLVVGMLISLLGFVELRRTERSIWLRQPGTNVDLQFSRSETSHRDTDKLRSQISFLSETPEAALQELAAWMTERGLTATVGRYSDREFYLDAPDAFVDFVIEAMLPELADYGVDP